MYFQYEFSTSVSTGSSTRVSIGVSPICSIGSSTRFSIRFSIGYSNRFNVPRLGCAAPLARDIATYHASAHALGQGDKSCDSLRSKSEFTEVNSGVAQWLACWAHNPKVRGSKPRSAMLHVRAEGNLARNSPSSMVEVMKIGGHAKQPRGNAHRASAGMARPIPSPPIPTAERQCHYRRASTS
jgi:hypothetical protein